MTLNTLHVAPVAQATDHLVQIYRSTPSVGLIPVIPVSVCPGLDPELCFIRPLLPVRRGCCSGRQSPTSSTFGNGVKRFKISTGSRHDNSTPTLMICVCATASVSKLTSLLKTCQFHWDLRVIVHRRISFDETIALSATAMSSGGCNEASPSMQMWRMRG